MNNLGAVTIENMIVVSKSHVVKEELDKEFYWIEAAKADPAQFGTFYNKYHEEIFRFVYQRLDDRELAADITQEVFLRAITNLPNYQFRGIPFGAWLYRIAKNELQQLFRKNKAKRTINIDDADLCDMIEDMRENKYEPYYDKLAGAISSLEEDDLQLIEMRYFEKKAFKEIGDILEITENNAKVRTYRILEELKKLIILKK